MQAEKSAPVVVRGLFNTEQAAEYLNTSEYFLEADRSKRRHCIPFVKIGRVVRYRPIDLDRYVEQHLVKLAEAA